MDFILILIFFLIGAGFHIMQKIGALREKFPSLTPKTVWTTFFNEEWNVLIISFLCLLLLESLHFVVTVKEVELGELAKKWWFLYVLSTLVGYAGQRLIYKYLGSAEAALNRKVGIQTTTTTQETPTEVTTKTETIETKPKE